MKIKLIYILISAAAIAQGVLWVNVFSLLHDGLLVYFGGVPAGVGIVGLVAYSANALPRVQSKRARQAGWIIMPLLIITEVIVLGFANYPKITHTPISNFGANVVSGGASLTITLALILGALVDRSLIPMPQKSSGAQRTVRRSAKKSEEVQAKSSALLSKYPRTCEYCDEQLKSPQAVGGHMKKHHPEHCIKKAYVMPIETGKVNYGNSNNQ